MTHDNENSSNTYTPAYDLAVSPQEEKKLLAEKDFNIIKKLLETANKLFQLKADITDKNEHDDLDKGITAMLKAAALSIHSNPDLQALVSLERQGKNSPYEGMLTQLIELSGTNLDQDIEYGQSIPASVRLQWQALGMDPDSENEVSEFLERNGISDSRQPKEENSPKIRK